MTARVVLGVAAVVLLVAGAITPTPPNGVDLLGFVLAALLIADVTLRTATGDVDADHTEGPRP